MSQRIQQRAEVPLEMDNERLDQVAAKLFPDFSRSRLQAWIKKGDLLVDGQQLRPRDKVRDGAQLSIDTEPEQAWMYLNTQRRVKRIATGQKTGAFLDQRENYLAAPRFARGPALDCFCSGGGFASIGAF